jgi:hypothetical protein
MKVHFLLICEGPSDEALIPHLRALLVKCGAEEATGITIDFDRFPTKMRTIEAKVKTAFKLEQNINLLFIHRDADSPDAEPRYAEISRGIENARYAGKWIGIVPVQETEAWLLLNEIAIRRVAGRPKGRIELNLPNPHRVEQVAKPKERLLEAILLASETAGRRRKQLTTKLPALRSKLLTELEVGGQLDLIQSWVRLKTDIELYIQVDDH